MLPLFIMMAYLIAPSVIVGNELNPRIEYEWDGDIPTLWKFAFDESLVAATIALVFFILLSLPQQSSGPCAQLNGITK